MDPGQGLKKFSLLKHTTEQSAGSTGSFQPFEVEERPVEKHQRVTSAAKRTKTASKVAVAGAVVATAAAGVAVASAVVSIVTRPPPVEAKSPGEKHMYSFAGHCLKSPCLTEDKGRVYCICKCEGCVEAVRLYNAHKLALTS